MINPTIAIIFDLDDTLCKEINYLKSAYSVIADKIALQVACNKDVILEQMLELYNSKQNVFQSILEQYKTNLTSTDLLSYYRNHKPNISLTPETVTLLNSLREKNIPLGLLTDGRSVQQRNKIEALKLEQYFSEIVISEEFGSEKPNVENYIHFEKSFNAEAYVYIGDNVKKDFVTANKLNWKTIKLINDGSNIHYNNDSDFDKSYLADYNINNLSEVYSLLFN